MNSEENKTQGRDSLNKYQKKVRNEERNSIHRRTHDLSNTVTN